MKLKTFYKIHYEYRFRKKLIILKLYTFVLLPINYLVNKILQPSKLNLDTNAKKIKIYTIKILNILLKILIEKKVRNI